MTKKQALITIIEIIDTCNNSDGCQKCAFGCGRHCLISDGNGTPNDWLINKKLENIWKEGDAE